ncbi:TRAP transporter large permease [Chloroflexota bacterium]
MDWVIPGIIVFVALLALLATGMPIAFAMGVVGVVGLLFFQGTEALYGIPVWTVGILNSFPLLAVPLYVFLGEILEFTGITEDLFGALRYFLRKLPGALNVSTIFGSAVFAAASGSSPATAVVMGRIAVPQMMRVGYNPGLSASTVAVGGTLGILIPPSIAMIIFGSMAEVSVGRLFLGGIIPGIVLALAMSIYVIFRCSVNRNLAPVTKERKTRREVLFLIGRTWPWLILIMSIMGSIYMGITTPTEAAALACAVAIALAIAYRRLHRKNLINALLSTVHTTCFVMLVLSSVYIFSRLTNFIGVTQGISSSVLGSDLPIWGVLGIIALIYFFLGMFIEPISIMLITIPIFMPIIRNLGIDPVWFGILTVINLEVALITPPVGMNVYVLYGIVNEYGVTLASLFRGVMGFLPIYFALMIILYLFPQLVLFIPNSMLGG